MVAYNITIKIDTDIQEEWLRWQQSEHIPEIMASGSFTHYKMFRLLEPKPAEGPTYVIQYFANSKDLYDRYIIDHAPGLREKAMLRWGDKFTAFRTVMELVN